MSRRNQTPSGSALKPIFLLALLGLVAAMPLEAGLRLPNVFSDHMVLQEGRPIPVWGWADPGEAVEVTLGSEKATATATADGKWRVDLGALQAGSDPLVLRVRGKTTVEFQDVLVGEVWLCSGQSNMEFGLVRAHNAETEIPRADHPRIRLFTVPRTASAQALDEVSPAPEAHPLMSAWQVCTPESVKTNGAWGGFPAVAYFFAKEIQAKTGKPVGLINASWGATSVQTWMSPDALAREPRFAASWKNYQKIATATDGAYPWSLSIQDERLRAFNERRTTPEWKALDTKWKAEVEAAKAAKAAGTTPPPQPPELKKPEAPNLSAATGLLYQGMIAPLVPYALRGVIWYQGEANVANAAEYAHLFPALIADWRRQWGQGDFPFLYVQLARFESPKTGSAPNPGRWAQLREAQRMTLTVPQTAMAVALDLGDSREIHPTNKEEVGRRLALAARRLAYGEDLVASGPLMESFQAEGGSVRVKFSHVGGGLVLGSPWFGQPDAVPEAKTRLLGFEVAGPDGIWHPADARIEGEAVVAGSGAVSSPVHVRYGWANDPVCNLFNREGLPASPFTTVPFK